jgi:hypothetical protein
MMVATSPLIKSVSLGRVDCTQEKQLCASQQVSAFPTLRVYRQHDTHSHENYHGDRTVEALHEFLQEAVEAVDEAAGFHPLTHLSHRAGEGCQVSGGVLISRVPGSLRLSAQSPQAAHSFDPLVMNATHHVDALLFVPPLFDRASDIEWSTQLHSHSLGAISDPGEQPPRARTQTQTHARTPHHPLFCPPSHRRRRRSPPCRRAAAAQGDLCHARAGHHAQALPQGGAAAADHRQRAGAARGPSLPLTPPVLSLSPAGLGPHFSERLHLGITAWCDAREQVSDTFQYSTNYNEFRPTELKPHAADPMQRLVPNAIFTYDISPYRVVHREEAESLGNFLTQLCAIVGGCFTVFGLIDSVLFHGIKAIKQD